MSKFVLNCVTERPGGVRQQVANGRLPQRGRRLGRPPPEPSRIRGSLKGRRDARRRLAGIEAALLSQLLMRPVPGGQPAGERQLSRQCRAATRPIPSPAPSRFSICRPFGVSGTSAAAPAHRLGRRSRARASASAAAIAPGPSATTARMPGPSPCPTVEASRPGPGRGRAGPGHRAYAVAASRSANLAGCAMCGKCPLSAQTSTVACGAAFSNQAAVSGDGSEPRISR